MTDRNVGLVVALTLAAVCVGAAIVLAAQYPETLPVGPFLGGLGVIIVALLGLDTYHRRHRDG